MVSSSSSFITVAMSTVRVSASLSSISSLLIIYVILQTEKRLSTIYHRIMFGMSCADIIGSVALALTSLPMPRVLPDWTKLDVDMDVNWLEYGTPRLGNWRTCEAQGFFFILGVYTMFYYNGSLAVYYACAIAFKMNEESIRKRIEVFLHSIAIGVGVSVALTPLLSNMYNPTPFEVGCVPKAIGCTGTDKEALCDLNYIDTCDMDDTVSYRGSRELDSYQTKYFIFTAIGCLLAIIFVAFGLVVYRVIKTQKSLKFDAETYDTIQRNIHDHLSYVSAIDTVNRIARNRLMDGHRNIKVVFFQSLAYILSFLLTLIFPLLRDMTGSYAAHKLYLIFSPLQGFFNFFIFIGHKVYNYRRQHPHVSRLDILRRLFTYRGSIEEPMIFSNVALVEMDKEGNGGANQEDDDNDVLVSDGSKEEQKQQREDGDETSSDPRMSSSAEILSYPSHFTNLQRSEGNDVLLDGRSVEERSTESCSLSGCVAPSSSSIISSSIISSKVNVDDADQDEESAFARK